jgi:hypothetical protein
MLHFKSLFQSLKGWHFKSYNILVINMQSYFVNHLETFIFGKWCMYYELLYVARHFDMNKYYYENLSVISQGFARRTVKKYLPALQRYLQLLW